MIKHRYAVPLDQLELNTGQLDWLPRNPRTWTQEDIDRTGASIKEDPDFLEERPLLVVPVPGHEHKWVVFAGNLRHEGAKAIGMPFVPVVEYQPATDEDRETIKRRAMKDNGSFGKWDWDTLANEWDDQPLGDWGIPAWDPQLGPQEVEKEIERNTAEEDDFDETKDEIHVICKMGDVWQLGEHRLMCGDSISLEDVQKLMGGG